MRVNPRISVILVCSSVFLIQVCRELPFVMPTAVVKQITKVHGPLVFCLFVCLFVIGKTAALSFGI